MNCDCMVSARRQKVVSGDTHAIAVETGESGCANLSGTTQSDTNYSAAFNVETTIATFTAFTPDSAVNSTFVFGAVRVQKLTNAGTVTLRIKESTTTLASATTGSLSAGAFFNFEVDFEGVNIAASAHTYTVTVAASTSNITVGVIAKALDCVSLTGSAGSCV